MFSFCQSPNLFISISSTKKKNSSLNVCAVSTKLCVTNVRKLVCTHDLKILFSIFCTLRKDFPKTHMQQGQSQDPSSYNVRTQFRLNLAGNTQKVRGKFLPLGLCLLTVSCGSKMFASSPPGSSLCYCRIFTLHYKAYCCDLVLHN